MHSLATRHEARDTEVISIPLIGQGSPEARTLDEQVEDVLAEALKIGELTKEEAEKVRLILAA